MKALFAVIVGIVSLSLYGEDKRAKEIPVAFLLSDTYPFGLQEVGSSASAALDDTIKMKVTVKSTKETFDDSRWTFHSVDSVGNEVKSQREGMEY